MYILGFKIIEHTNHQQQFECKARVVNFELRENDIVTQHHATAGRSFVYCKFACRQTPFAEINILHHMY